MKMTSQLADMRLSPDFFGVAVFLLSSLVTGPTFLSISVLVLELGQFSFSKGLTKNPEIGNNPIEFCLISGDWVRLGTPNLVRMSVMKSYCICKFPGLI